MPQTEPQMVETARFSSEPGGAAAFTIRGEGHLGPLRVLQQFVASIEPEKAFLRLTAGDHRLHLARFHFPDSTPYLMICPPGERSGSTIDQARLQGTGWSYEANIPGGVMDAMNTFATQHGPREGTKTLRLIDSRGSQTIVLQCQPDQILRLAIRAGIHKS